MINTNKFIPVSLSDGCYRDKRIFSPLFVITLLKTNKKKPTAKKGNIPQSTITRLGIES